MGKFRVDFEGLLKTLIQYNVEFVVVGGVSAVLHGAPMATFDLDIVHHRTPDNIDRLLQALEQLNARYRGQGDRLLKPERSHLLSEGHQLLLTDRGPLDVLGVIGSNLDYNDLIAQTIELEIENFRIRVLKLETLIKVKEEIAHPKDKAVLAILRQTLKES